MDYKEIDTVDEALSVLIKKYIINGAEYWLKAADTTFNVKELLIKFANYVNKL